MNLIGGKVIHRKFGEGIIVEVKDSSFTCSKLFLFSKFSILLL